MPPVHGGATRTKQEEWLMKFYERIEVIVIPPEGIKEKRHVHPLKIPFEFSHDGGGYSTYFNLRRIGFLEYARHCIFIFIGRFINVVTFGGLEGFPIDHSKHRGNYGRIFDKSAIARRG